MAWNFIMDFIMDIPEQPTVWPPAPTVAPPEPSSLQSKLPQWFGEALKGSAEYTAVMYVGATVFRLWDSHQLPHWTFYAEAPVVAFIVIGIVKWQKFKPKP